MSPRLILVHAFLPSMAPTIEAFKTIWPEAEILNLLDESLYADVSPEGVMLPDVPGRVASVLRHAVASRAEGIVFTGSTFGPAVDAARTGAAVPILRSDEAMADEAVKLGQPILLVATAKRAMPVLRGNLEGAAKAAGRSIDVTELWVEGAKEAISVGDFDKHDRLIAAAVTAAKPSGVILFGQISMIPSRRLLPTSLAEKVITSAEAAARRLRALLHA